MAVRMRPPVDQPSRSRRTMASSIPEPQTPTGDHRRWSRRASAPSIVTRSMAPSARMPEMCPPSSAGPGDRKPTRFRRPYDRNFGIRADVHDQRNAGVSHRWRGARRARRHGRTRRSRRCSQRHAPWPGAKAQAERSRSQKPRQHRAATRRRARPGVAHRQPSSRCCIAVLPQTATSRTSSPALRRRLREVVGERVDRSGRRPVIHPADAVAPRRD